MPDQEQSTEPNPQPVALTPTVDPTRWEDFEGFRESFLLWFTDPTANDALRKVAGVLYEMVLEFGAHWPHQPEGEIRAELRASLADLRFCQGYLASVGAVPQEASATPYEEHLCRVAARQAEAVRKAADAIEAELGTWRGEGAQ